MVFRKLRTRALRAFSLIELLMVIAIFSVISLIVIANHSKFNSSVLLGSLAYNIALSVREAQVYGLSVHQYGSSFQIGYGTHFEGNASYILFADTNANRRYDSGTDGAVKTYTLSQHHAISRFCGVKSTGEKDCSDGSSGELIEYLDIVFFRPEPDANISSDQFNIYSRAEVQVSSPSGEIRLITIASTGQIAVQNP